MTHRKNTLRIKCICLVVLLLFTNCDKNKITEKEDSLILTDVVGNQIQIRNQSKDEAITILKEEQIYDNQEVWFFIDRNFYEIFEFDGLSSDVPKEEVSDSLAVIWFSKDPDSKDELIAEYRNSNPKIHSKRWTLTITYDEKKNQIIDVEYQF